MFDFKSGRSGAKGQPETAKTDDPNAASQSSAQKQEAITRAQALAGDEAASVEFVLSSAFADARLIAAENIVSRAALEQVVPAVRNVDRRVARLLQGRLDEIKHREFAQRQAVQCITQAEALVREPRLLPNQVVDLDHAWQIIQLVPEEQAAQFATVRARLAERLAEQARLQHEVIEVGAGLRRLLDDPAAGREAIAAGLEGAATALAAHLAAPEAPGLPPHLLADLESWRSRLQARLDAPATVPAAAQTAPTSPESAAAPAAGTPAGSSAPKQQKPARPENPELKARFDAALESLESAAKAGTLHEALEADRQLRSGELQAWRPNEAQNARLVAARAELGRLQGWARWSGNVSREELMKAAETLPEQKLPPSELAARVGALREQWKALDLSAGAAGKELWTRFDQACTAAYAPAAAHFKRLADEREQNKLKAQALLEQVKAHVAALPAADAIDWKALAHFTAHHAQSWQRMGAMERKERKRLDAEFKAAMAPMETLLNERRSTELQEREKLIEQAAALNPAQRGALDRLRELQERWQTRAKQLPLERRDEQALWQRFRKACDTAFKARKDAVKAADADRKDHLHVREALCARLEAGVGLPENEVNKLLREVREAWSKAGPVPRASEKQIDARYQKALAALQHSANIARRAQKQGQLHAVLDKLKLCQQAEAALVAGTAPDAALDETWKALPLAPGANEKLLRARFDAALAAPSGYAERIKANTAVLQRELLRTEISMGIESPAALAGERLKAQVEVLQASLKAGQKQKSVPERLQELLQLPAAVDDADQARLAKVIERGVTD